MPSVENTVVQSCIPRKKAKWRRSILHRADNIARRYFKSSVIRAAILSRSRFFVQPVQFSVFLLFLRPLCISFLSPLYRAILWRCSDFEVATCLRIVSPGHPFTSSLESRVENVSRLPNRGARGHES